MIVLCAGHRPDAVGFRHGPITEHDVCVRGVASLINKGGYTAIRSGTLEQKMAECKTLSGAALLIEFHLRQHRCQRPELLYAPKDNARRELCHTLQRPLSKMLLRNVEVKPGWYRNQMRFGVEFMLARMPVPTILVSLATIQDRNLDPERLANCFHKSLQYI